MGRKKRYIPDGGALVEVSTRTLHGRLLLRPSTDLNEIIPGVLGKALEYCPVELVAASFLSSHYLCAALHK